MHVSIRGDVLRFFSIKFRKNTPRTMICTWLWPSKHGDIRCRYAASTWRRTPFTWHSMRAPSAVHNFHSLSPVTETKPGQHVQDTSENSGQLPHHAGGPLLNHSPLPQPYPRCRRYSVDPRLVEHAGTWGMLMLGLARSANSINSEKMKPNAQHCCIMMMEFQTRYAVRIITVYEFRLAWNGHATARHRQVL